MWIVARFSPLEWKEPELCDDCLLEKIIQDELGDGGDFNPCEGHSCESSNTGSDCNAREHNRFAEDYVFISSKRINSEVENDNLHLSVLENDFTIGNSFWFAIGTLMQQGSDLNPKVQYLLLLQYNSIKCTVQL